jgi:hypothetical protein
MLEVGFYWTIVAGAPQPLQELAVREFREGKWRECGDEVWYWEDQFNVASERLIPPELP